MSNSCTVTNPFLVLNCILKNAESQIKIHQEVIEIWLLFLQFHLYNRRQRRIMNLKDVVFMKIKEMRTQTGLSQTKFADLFGIPVATLKDWEQGRRKPPEYVATMIRTILEFKKMI